MRDRNNGQVVDAGKITRVARIHRQAIREGRGGDHCIVRACGALSTTSPKRGGEQPRQENDSARVQDAARGNRGAHYNRPSRKASTSPRNASGSIVGKCLQRARSAAADSFDCAYGRSSATGFPSRVMVTCSPRATRSMTWPPLLRNSRTLTWPTPTSVSRVRPGFTRSNSSK